MIVSVYLNENLAEKLIECPNVIFYGYMWREWSMSPAFPASIDELKQIIISDNVTGDMLQSVWQELNNRLDVYHVIDDVHIDHFRNRSQNKLMMFNK